jgi:branched-chain amino acid transport system permease protein
MNRAPLPLRIVMWGAAAVVLVILPFQFPPFRVEQFGQWMAIAVAAAGLNLLTGYNGQISVGHGALYGVGAYTVAILVSDAGWPLLLTVPAAMVICFLVGVVIGLPALRIQGLYLALVTLAVATLFPLALEQFSGLTGGGGGKALTSDQMSRRCQMHPGEPTEACLETLRPRPVRWESPIDSLKPDQFKYFIFLAITVVVFVLVANLVRSRMGRALVAIRDNETAAEVSGINTSRTKILTFGISAGIAGIGGSIFALNAGQVNPTSFTLTVSIYFLVAVVVGGAATVTGPAIGALVYGLFVDFLAPELPERFKAATPVILGVLLIVQMLAAPSGVVGSYRQLMGRLAARRGRGGAGGTVEPMDAQPGSSAEPAG